LADAADAAVRRAALAVVAGVVGQHIVAGVGQMLVSGRRR
jgi:hypothetical protein